MECTAFCLPDAEKREAEWARQNKMPSSETFFCFSFFVIQGEMVGGKKLSDGFVSYLQRSLSGVSFVGHSKG